MKVEELAALVVDACEAEKVLHMVTGAIAYNLYGIPRSTKDVDVVIGTSDAGGMDRVVARLAPIVEFDPQVQFDTLTWGRRLVGVFELFDGPFVQEQFNRRRRMQSAQFNRTTWVPTPEDVVVQKLRWGRNEDLDDARDVLAVQGTESLDINYIQDWCARHDTTARLRSVLDSISPL